MKYAQLRSAGFAELARLWSQCEAPQVSTFYGPTDDRTIDEVIAEIEALVLDARIS